MFFVSNITTHQDTIVALSTPFGVGGIAVIRLSGKSAIRIVNKVFRSSSKSKDLNLLASYTAHYGQIINKNTLVDEVVVTLFKAPNSYTGDDVIEVSCHGSTVIQQELVQCFIEHGARAAEAGEFTQRAFLNGKLDLSQTEAVADLIHSKSELSKNIALNQLRGGFSSDLQEIKQRLIEFASLIELELDFSEEDVEFADRIQLEQLIKKTLDKVSLLTQSFKIGNAIKNGINTPIIGKPNAGKSTLLNAILNEERAIVTDIPGTTRDTLEETIIINGMMFRFIDTAGLRDTDDTVEKIGVERAIQSVLKSQIYLYIFDVSKTTLADLKLEIADLPKDIPHILIGNKADLLIESDKTLWESNDNIFLMSAIAKDNINLLKQQLLQKLALGNITPTTTIITNARHYNALQLVEISLKDILIGLQSNISSDLLAIDLRQALHHLGSITGEITNDDVLGSIFANFCIGK